MFFKLLILYTIQNIASLLFIVYFFTGFSISQAQAGYFILFAIFLAVINYLSDPVIKFFTLKIKFISIWLFNFLLTIPLLYLADLLLPGIHIKAGMFRDTNLGVFQIHSFPMNEILTVVIASLILGFGAALIRWLNE